MATISDGVTTHTPMLILSTMLEQETGNVILQPIDTIEPFISLAPALTPTESLQLLCADEPAAVEIRQVLASGRVISVTTDTRSYQCVLAGRLRHERHTSTSRWIVTAEVRHL